MCTKFGADSSSHFHLKVRKTNKQTYIAGGYIAGVGKYNENICNARMGGKTNVLESCFGG